MKKLMMAVVAACAAIGAHSATTADYVQDGLVAMWDGWENAGQGNHDGTKTEWVDVVGGRVLTLAAGESFNDCEVTLVAGAHYTEDELFDAPGDITIEVNGRPVSPTSQYSMLVAGIPNFAELSWDARNGGMSIKRVDSAAATENHYITYNSGYASASAIAKADVSQTYTTLIGVNSSAVYVNGQSRAQTNGMDWKGNARSSDFRVQVGNASSGEAIRNIRIYNRKLTPEEVAANYAVDVKRFVDKDIYGDNGVLVVGEPQNYTLADSPSYGFIEKTLGDQVEMTAPDYVELTDGKHKRCGGWRLYDRKTDELIAESTDATRLTCAFEFEKPVRLVWLWNVLRVPGCYATIADAVAEAQSGDEIVLAKSTEPYVLAAKVTLPAGVSVRGETDDFNDVIISGGGKLGTAFTLNNNSSVSNMTFTLFTGTVVGDAAWNGPYNIVNCRFTAITNSSAYGPAVINQTGWGTVSRLVFDNCRLGANNGSGLVGLGTASAVYDQLVITNNFVQSAFASDGNFRLIGGSGTVKNSFIGNNTLGPIRDRYLAAGNAYGPVMSSSVTLQNCVIVNNTFVGCATGFGAVNSTGGSVKHCIILDNGLGTDNWSKTVGSRYSYCLSTETETMNSSVEGDWGDVVAKPGELPWLPYGSKAIGAGENGGDIGRLWTPETLQCAVKADKRGYVGAATANLLALASEEATFAWTLVSGPATLTPDGENATLVFNGLGTAVVRVTATTASETATDEIAVVSTQPVYEVATAAELVEAVDAAQDGAEIVIAAGDYVPSKTLVLRNAVTVRGATGNRGDVTVSGNKARGVFTIHHPGAVISSLTVKDGVAASGGGVLMEIGGTVTNVAVHGCSGSGWFCEFNSANWYFNGGGAVANWNGTVVDCDISANKHTSTYNSIAAYGQHGPLAFADRIVVTNNTSTSGVDKYKYRVAPVAITGGGTIRNAFVANNDAGRPPLGTTAQDTCGVYVQDGTLENSTVFRNRVNVDYFGYAAGVYVEANGSVVNCLVTENGDTEGNVDNYRIASGATFDHCATAPVPEEGTECVDYSASPLTLYDINAAGYPVPKPETPTVDTGADLDWTVEPTAIDLFGNLRKQGDLTDIGAYERKPSTDALLCELTVICDAAAAAPYDVTLGAIVSGSRKTGLSYSWSAIRTYLGVVTTNTVVTADPAYVFTDLEKGDWAFALTVTNDHEPPDVATSETDGSILHLSPAICYVSPSGSHEWPYDTPQIAATNFIDVAAEARGRVIVLPGAYENLPHVTDANGKDFVGIFDKSVTIEGPDDPRAATINCEGRGGLKLENRDAKLWGVAFTNFSIGTSQSALTVAAGLASNVVVDAGKKYGWQGANYVNVGPGATLTDSLLTGSKTTNWQGGYVLSCKGGLVKNCRIVDNHSDDSRIFYLAYDSGIQRPGRMEGCVITNNSSFYSFCDFSGAVVVEDCLFEKNNTAYNNGNYPLISLPASAVLRRCRILRNKIQSTLIGCAGWDLTAPPRIENCLIADNTLTSRGGYAFYVTPNVNAAASVLNTTIVNNQGGGIYYGNNVGVTYPSQFYMTNSVVWANYPVGATAATNVIGTVSAPKLAHNCYSEAVEDDGNFNTAQDPQLRASGRKIYQPKPTSPCVATGDAWFWTEDDVDIAGNPRLRKGAVDMGCYEPLFLGLLLLVK